MRSLLAFTSATLHFRGQNFLISFKSGHVCPRYLCLCITRRFIPKSLTCVYRYTPGLLTQDTTTYPAIPNLPIPALYPQTANFVLLPLEYPNYTPRILVVGGSTVDRATPGKTSLCQLEPMLLLLWHAVCFWQVSIVAPGQTNILGVSVMQELQANLIFAMSGWMNRIKPFVTSPVQGITAWHV